MANGDRVDFERIFLEFLDDRERTMGSEAGGLRAFYSRRRQRGCAFNPNEAAAIDLVTEHLPGYDAYVEIGAGLGELACWLAISGLRVVAIEQDPARFAGIKDLSLAAVRTWPGIEDRLSLIAAAFPCPVLQVDPNRTLVLTTNLVFRTTYETEQQIIGEIAQYRAALVDTVRFCRDRFTEDEWIALDRRFAAAGLPNQRVVWPSGPGTGTDERIVWYQRPTA